MKVLYTFGGMPHYLNAMLNKLHNKGVEETGYSDNGMALFPASVLSTPIEKGYERVPDTVGYP